MSDVCTRCGKPFPQCNCNRPSFLGTEAAAFAAEHGSDSPEPRLEGLVDVRGRIWAYNDVADAYTLPPGVTEVLTPAGLGAGISWFGSEQIDDYAGLLGPFTEVRI